MPTGDFSHSSFFYLERLLQMDPILGLLGVLGVAAAVHSRKEPPRLLALCWVVATLAAMFAFQAKNLPYLVFLVPGLTILGALCAPRFLDHRPLITASLLLVLFTVKALGGDRPWSLRPGAPPIQGARAMRAYYDLHRDTELIDAQPDDEFYSATIPLPRVRYALVDPTRIVARTVPYYVPLGIVVTGREFLSLPDLLPGYRENLRKWGFDSTEPVGSTILLDSPEQLEELVRANPHSDFYLPSEWLAAMHDPDAAHWVAHYSPERVFLLSKTARPRKSAPSIPAKW